MNKLWDCPWNKAKTRSTMLRRLIAVLNTLHSSWHWKKQGLKENSIIFCATAQASQAIDWALTPSHQGGWQAKALFPPPLSWCKGWELLNSQLCYFFWPSSPFRCMPLLAGPRCLAPFSMLLFCSFTRAEMLAWPRWNKAAAQAETWGQDRRGTHCSFLSSTSMVFATVQLNCRSYLLFR